MEIFVFIKNMLFALRINWLNFFFANILNMCNNNKSPSILNAISQQLNLFSFRLNNSAPINVLASIHHQTKRRRRRRVDIHITVITIPPKVFIINELSGVCGMQTIAYSLHQQRDTLAFR